ncbi:MAG: DUF4367 domain-containing protein [Oscillospiraceae bacterium]|nr:DUF4367 domain-containing protein [Oscillospiraceae bacterium]
MISDKELQEASRRYEKALLAGLPEPEECPAVFSPAFERKMKKLIFRVDHPVRFWMRLLLPVLLAAVLAMLLPKEPVPPPEPPALVEREPAPEPPETIVYRPTWLPEGCAWAREALYGSEGMIVYQTPGGDEAVFFYDLNGREEDHEGEAVRVGDGAGTLLLGRSKGELNELFWSGEGVSFWLTAPFTGEDLIRVAESVEKEAPASAS